MNISSYRHFLKQQHTLKVWLSADSEKHICNSISFLLKTLSKPQWDGLIFVLTSVKKYASRKLVEIQFEVTTCHQERDSLACLEMELTCLTFSILWGGSTGELPDSWQVMFWTWKGASLGMFLHAGMENQHGGSGFRINNTTVGGYISQMRIYWYLHIFTVCVYTIVEPWNSPWQGSSYHDWKKNNHDMIPCLFPTNLAFFHFIKKILHFFIFFEAFQSIFEAFLAGLCGFWTGLYGFLAGLCGFLAGLWWFLAGLWRFLAGIRAFDYFLSDFRQKQAKK